MGNETNLENWAARERLRWVEVMLWWQGWVGRAALREVFGISAAQASSDLQKYAELNAGAMAYHTSRKRYESGARMKCVLHEPALEEGLALLDEGMSRLPRVGVEEGALVGLVSLPKRGAKRTVARRIVLAALTGQQVRVRYHSVASGTARERVLVPRAFGWDGHRWHARAWDGESGEWRDFVLGRMEKVAWPEEWAGKLPKDADWEKWVKVRLKVNPKLKKEAREALRMDYGLAGDVLELRVRKAMEAYLLAGLFLEEETGRDLPRHFVLD